MDVDEIGPSLRYAVVKPKVVATEQRQDSHTAEDEHRFDIFGCPARMVSADRPGFSLPSTAQHAIAVDQVTGRC